MTLPLYFAPINTLGNADYRHVLLKHGADFVFSELLLADKLGEEHYQRKLTLPADDSVKTIFQIGAKSSDEVERAILFLTQTIPQIKEINLNMGCPQSSMQQRGVCGGLLYNQELMGELAASLAHNCKVKNIIPSVKLRLGTSPTNIKITEYIATLRKAHIKKIYIHLRPLRYNYTHPAIIKPVIGLQEKFSDVEIILNGDIDSFKAYEVLTTTASCRGVMIGRAALSNPFIFEQIKNKTNSSHGPYNPLAKDPHLLCKGQQVIMDKEKQAIIISFLRAASIPLSVLKANLSWLIKGVSARRKFIGVIAEEQNKKAIIERFKEHFSS